MGEGAKSRPTKKQRELLNFIENFIASNGYGPSYREIMQGCGYHSVATVAAHVRNLTAKGQLRKNGRSARSLEVAGDTSQPAKLATNVVKPSEEKWLVDKIDYHFRQVESAQSVSQSDIDGLYVLAGALKVLGLEGAAQSFNTRLGKLRSRAERVQ
jgi:SOS-response transcriptional repressor LexA